MRRRWQELTDGVSDLTIHLRLARNFPGSEKGRASTRILLAHYREEAEIEMRAHHKNVAGEISDYMFKTSRVDPMMEDFANFLKRKVFLADDPVAEATRLIGPSVQAAPKPRKTKKIRALGKIRF